MKRCTKCGETKAFEMFVKDKSRKDGMYPRCKLCQAAYCTANRETIATRKREYQAANRETIASKTREYHAANRETIAVWKREHYVANRETIASKTREYRAANRETIAARAREYRAANRETIATRKRGYHIANREALRAKSREYYNANRETLAARNREYRVANPEVPRAGSQRRRARKRAVECDPSIRLSDVIAHYGPHCYLCGVETDPSAPVRSRFKCELEHVVPLSKGGPHALENLRPACRPCNRLKGARLTAEQVRALYEEMLS